MTDTPCVSGRPVHQRAHPYALRHARPPGRRRGLLYQRGKGMDPVVRPDAGEADLASLQAVSMSRMKIDIPGIPVLAEHLIEFRPILLICLKNGLNNANDSIALVLRSILCSLKRFASFSLAH